MLGKLLKRKKMFVVLAVMALLTSCSGGYDTPSTTATPAVISADAVNGYVTVGKVNGTGYDRVVILDVTSSATYSNGHIPGRHMM